MNGERPPGREAGTGTSALRPDQSDPESQWPDRGVCAGR